MGRLNKSAKEGYTYRSPNQTNARDLTPNPQEDVVASNEADLDRIGRGLRAETRGERALAREGNQGYADRARTQEAAGRAVSRTAGRLGATQAAFMLGNRIGEEIDKRNPKIGQAINKVIDKVSVPSNRFKLTKEAQERVDQEQAFKDVGDAMQRVKNNEDRGYKKGGKVGSVSKRADGIAKRGKTRGVMR
jgi:hypothetical protein